MGAPLDWQVTLADTWVLGSEVYLDHYNEVGLGLIRLREKTGGTRRERAGLPLSYLFGENYQSAAALLNWEF